ncbi:hypothetical protein D3C77_600110 [compost metagenome]
MLDADECPNDLFVVDGCIQPPAGVIHLEDAADFSGGDRSAFHSLNNRREANGVGLIANLPPCTPCLESRLGRNYGFAIFLKVIQRQVCGLISTVFGEVADRCQM